VFVGDREREHAAVALREHYARGRLTVEELSDRIAEVVAARSQRELRRAMAGLSSESAEIVERGRNAAQAVLRGLALVMFTGAYLVFSFALLLVFALTLLIHGASTAAAVAFLVAWLVPTYLLFRLWHRRPPRERAGI
jgi:Flp pilus assembly protein TadB